MNEEHNKNAEPTFNTENQRRALDRMSADLLDKLNTMITEQEQRVQDFSLQQNSLSPRPMKMEEPGIARTVTSFPQAKPLKTNLSAPPTDELVISYDDGINKGDIPHPRKRSVTPPPIKARKQPQPHYNVPRPPLPKGAMPMDEQEKKDSAVGCGTIAFAVFVIIMLLRACS